ncbi:MAG: alkyl hydroperoxide reductase subunit F [Pseudomonadota bacterium]
MRLTKDILATLTEYASRLEAAVQLRLQEPGAEAHPKREELETFLADFCSVSDQLELIHGDFGLRGPVSFDLCVDGQPQGVLFSGVPGGHEFNSLVLAVLNAGGVPIKLDEAVQKLVGRVDESLHFEVFVSLSCHNCPDVVQTLNQFALLNGQIRSEMIDGGLFPDVVEAREIQGVPSVYLNGELFANGKVDAAKLVEKLIEQVPGLIEVQSEPELPLQDVTVIGGGPAGVSAAIYAARKGLHTTLVTDRLGGQLKDTLGIENLISVPYTTGPELSGALLNHMDQYDITLKENVSVEQIEAVHGPKRVTLSTGEIIDTKTLVIATGARWRELGVPGEKENIGNGVAFCPHCDGPFFKGKDVAVVGGGNSGIEAALDLCNIASSVTVFEFLPDLKADDVLVKQAQSRDNITIHTNVAVQEITAEGGKVNGLNYLDRASEASKAQTLDGVFVQIGLIPNSQCVRDLVDVTQYGEIVVDDKCRTSVDGIFACGDVTTTPYKQIIISMGEGAKASLSAFEYLLTEYAEAPQAEEVLEASA